MTVHLVATGAFWLFERTWTSGTGVLWEAMVACGAGFAAFVGYFRCSAQKIGDRAWQEYLRQLMMVGAVPVSMWAYFTQRFVGGVDAKWYAYVLADHIEQMRAGVFPVLVGQGQYAFSGAVHPYRTAPYYQNLGGLLDSATGGSLTVFGVQHLTVVVSLLAAIVISYVCLISFAPAKRWLSALIAIAYATSPGLVGLVATQEMYMSYMVAPWLPLVAWGVAGSLSARGWFPHVVTAASLAGLWYCHSPIALWSTIAAFGVLVVNAISVRGGFAAFVGMVFTLTILGVLTFFQFRSVGEFTAGTVGNELSKGWPLLAALCGLIAGGRYLIFGNWIWAATALLVAITLVFIDKRLFALVAPIVVTVSGVAIYSVNRSEHVVGRGWGHRLVAWGILVGLIAAAQVSMSIGAEISGTAQAAAAFPREFWPGIVIPIGESFRLSDVQPGYAVAGLGVVSLLGLAIGRSFNCAPATITIYFALLLLPIPLVSERLWGLLPTEMLVATSGAVSLRLMPVWVTIMSAAGAAMLFALCRNRKWLDWVAVAILVSLAGWNLWQLQWFNRRLAAMTNSALVSSDSLRTENAPMAIYHYNFLGLSRYFSHGVMDFREESRLLSVATMERLSGTASQSGHLEQFTLVARPGGPNGWTDLNRQIVLQPGECIRVTFKFMVSDADGYLIFSGSRIYREYILPSSGGGSGFGSGTTNARSMTLWNSLDEPISMQMYWITPRSLPTEGVPFAEVAVSRVSDSNRAVRTISLIPYVAEVSLPEAAILETPRRFVDGYSAVVNGTTVAPVQTAAGHVGVPVPAGNSRVEVTFRGTSRLWSAFWLSTTGWGLVALVVLVRTVRVLFSSELKIA